MLSDSEEQFQQKNVLIDMRYKNKPTSNKDCVKGAYGRCPDRRPKTAVILTTQKDLECRCMKKYKQNKNKVVRPLKKKKKVNKLVQLDSFKVLIR